MSFLEISRLKEIAKELEEEYETGYTELSKFRTEAGKELQANMIDITRFIISFEASYISTSLGAELLDSLNLKIMIKERKTEIIEEISENKGLTLENSTQFYDLITEYMDESSNISTKEIISALPFMNPEFKTMEHLYAHFFVSLVTYIDLYTMNLSREIILELDTKDYVEFLKGFNPMKNPKERINFLA